MGPVKYCYKFEICAMGSVIQTIQICCCALKSNNLSNGKTSHRTKKNNNKGNNYVSHNMSMR